MEWRLYRSTLGISESNNINLNSVLMPSFPKSSPFSAPRAILDFCNLSFIGLLIMFVEPTICPSTLTFVSFSMSQKGSGDLAICFLFLPLFVAGVNTFSQLIVKFTGSSVSLYVCNFGSISLISLYPIFASSA